jgi:hypothetical protein
MDFSDLSFYRSLFMKAAFFAVLLVIICSSSKCDSISSKPLDQNVTYPPRLKETTWADIETQFDSLKYECKSLGDAVVSDIKDRGLMGSIKYRKKFYGSLFLFSILVIIWLRNQKR